MVRTDLNDSVKPSKNLQSLYQNCLDSLPEAQQGLVQGEQGLREGRGNLFAGFKTNSAFLNHGIVSFLRRVASREGLNLEPMLFQVKSAFHSFAKLFLCLVCMLDFRSLHEDLKNK